MKRLLYLLLTALLCVCAVGCSEEVGDSYGASDTDTAASESVEEGFTDNETSVDENSDTELKELGAFHSYLTTVIAPSCTEKGYTVYRCECGDGYESDEVAALGHTPLEAVCENFCEASCTESGGYDTVVYCAVCGVELSRESVFLEVMGHREITVEGKAATCVEDGLTDGTVCGICGEVTVVQYAISALGHREVTVEGKAATCVEDGLTDGAVCGICGEVTVAQYAISALGHREVTVEGKAATCVEDGLTDGEVCGICGEVTVVQAVIPAYGHSGTVRRENVLDATCTEDGYYLLTESCLNCRAELSAEVVSVPARGHSDAVFSREQVVESDCVNNGSYLSVGRCRDCGEVLDSAFVVTATIPHDYQKRGTVAATCTEMGYGVYACSVCGDYYSADPVSPYGHRFIKSAHVMPTCVSDGYEEYACCVCGEKERNVLALKGHIYFSNTVSPTLDSEGYTLNTCSLCGYSYVSAVTERLKHYYSVKYYANGGEGYTASSAHVYGRQGALTVCGFTRENHVFLGWAYSENAVEPTFTDGQTVGDLTSFESVIELYAVWLKTGYSEWTSVTNGYWEINDGDGDGYRYLHLDSSYLDRDRLIEAGYTKVRVSITIWAWRVDKGNQFIAVCTSNGSRDIAKSGAIGLTKTRTAVTREFVINISDLDSSGRIGAHFTASGSGGDTYRFDKIQFKVTCVG